MKRRHWLLLPVAALCAPCAHAVDYGTATHPTRADHWRLVLAERPGPCPPAAEASAGACIGTAPARREWPVTAGDRIAVEFGEDAHWTGDLVVRTRRFFVPLRDLESRPEPATITIDALGAGGARLVVEQAGSRFTVAVSSTEWVEIPLSDAGLHLFARLAAPGDPSN